MTSPCEHKHCTGCLACLNICRHNAILLHTDEEGFVYPHIDEEACVNCGLCYKACPANDTELKTSLPLRAYAAWAKNKDIHRHSSSGGLFSVISEFVLRQGGIVYGAAFDEEWNVIHTFAENSRHLKKLRGSKYAQSNIKYSYKEIEQKLKAGTKVLFVGTPCQIAGIKQFMSIKKTNTDNMITIDLACHGVPSPLIFKKYLNYLENKHHSKLSHYMFREKIWSWKRYNTKAIFKNHCCYRGKWEEDIYMRGFLRDLFLRESCHTCKYACQIRQGDITLSDYWNYWPRENEIINNDTGVSVVLTNTSKGSDIIQAIKNELLIYPREIDDALHSSQPYIKPFPASPLRDEFWTDYKTHDFSYLIEKYFFPEPINPHYAHIYKYGRYFSPYAKKIHDKFGGIINKMILIFRQSKTI